MYLTIMADKYCIGNDATYAFERCAFVVAGETKRCLFMHCFYCVQRINGPFLAKLRGRIARMRIDFPCRRCSDNCKRWNCIKFSYETSDAISLRKWCLPTGSSVGTTSLKYAGLPYEVVKSCAMQTTRRTSDFPLLEPWVLAGADF